MRWLVLGYQSWRAADLVWQKKGRGGRRQQESCWDTWAFKPFLLCDNTQILGGDCAGEWHILKSSFLSEELASFSLNTKHSLPCSMGVGLQKYTCEDWILAITSPWKLGSKITDDMWFKGTHGRIFSLGIIPLGLGPWVGRYQVWADRWKNRGIWGQTQETLSQDRFGVRGEKGRRRNGIFSWVNACQSAPGMCWPHYQRGQENMRYVHHLLAQSWLL